MKRDLDEYTQCTAVTPSELRDILSERDEQKSFDDGKRKPIQLLKGDGNAYYALCNDGSMWCTTQPNMIVSGKWRRMPDVPQDDVPS